ncbi:MAG: amidohydrolase, partial [Chloroflexi bacterium]
MSIVDFRVRLPTELRPAVDLPAEYVDRYDAVLGLEERRDMSLDALVAEMDVAGVSHAVVHAEYEYGDPADDLNEAVAALVAKMPDRFSGYGTVSLAP